MTNLNDAQFGRMSRDEFAQQFYHHTRPAHRESVESSGLLPQRPYDGPKGVYLHPSVDSAHEYIKAQGLGEQDIYEVSPASVKRDPLDDRYWYSPRRIPPSRLRRLATHEDFVSRAQEFNRAGEGH